jgi:catechol 2,3-dioxygenase-like lactoylglutathione lyase family enzyme
MRLNQVTVASRDVARAAAFYEALGLELIVRDLPSYVRFRCPDGDSTFSVELDVDTVGGGGTTVYFECDDLDARVIRLKALGIAFECDPVDQPWLWREARLRDPDGNWLCLFKAGTNRLDPPWRIRSG